MDGFLAHERGGDGFTSFVQQGSVPVHVVHNGFQNLPSSKIGSSAAVGR